MAAERQARRDIDDLRKSWSDRESGGGEKGDEVYDRIENGRSIRRFLPNVDPDEPFFLMYAMHYNMGPDNQGSFRCIEPGGPFGHIPQRDKDRNYKAKKCPSCKTFCKNKTKGRMFKFGTDEGKEWWKNRVAPWRAKYMFVAATIDPKSKKGRLRPKILMKGPTIFKTLIDAFYDEDAGGDFTDPKTGRSVIINRRQLSKQDATNVEYKVQISPDRKPIYKWKVLRKRLPTLSAFLPPELEPDAIQAIIDGDGDEDTVSSSKKRNKRRTDDDDDYGHSDLDGGDDDEDEDAVSRKLRLGKRSKRNEDDVDLDAPEIDADEEKRRKKKKSKLRKKLEAKAQKKRR